MDLVTRSVRIRGFIAGILLALIISARPASAQGSAESALFVDGSVFAGLEFRNRTQFSGSLTEETGEDPSDQVLGAGFALGTFLAPRVSARLEIARLGETALHTESSIGENETSIVDRFIAAQSYSVLAGYHPPATGRLRLAYLAGVAFIRLREEFIQQLQSDGFPPLNQPTVETIQGVQVVYGPTVMLGLDAAMRLGRHVEVVPQIRVTSASGLSVRPGVALRVTP